VNNAPYLRANWLSITGSVRDHNEDAIGIYQHADAHMYVLCDGVGGAEAGEFVSEFAIKRMLKMFHENVGKSASVNWSALMEQTIGEINAEVRRSADAASAQSGTTVMMGSTIVAAVIQGWNVFVAHVGDSRLYHWRGGGIVQATTDHSAGTTMYNMPAIRPDGSTKQNVLARGIGKGDTISADLLLISLQAGDKLLLCSDGMSDKVATEEVAQVLATMPLQTAPEYLAQTADSRMSRDNVSVMLIEVNAAPDAPSITPPEQERAFVGYNPRWATTQFKAAGIPGSKKSGGKSRGLIFGLVALLIVALVIIGVLVANSAQNAGGDSPAATTQGTSVPAAITEDVVPTDTPVPTDTATSTPTPTDTPTPTETPIPPTVTPRT
jgi:protein phosphatase